MKYLTIVSDLGYRGTQRAAQNYSLAMAKRGHDVAVLSLTGGGREVILRDNGVKVWVCNGQLYEAIGKARDFDPSIIHIHRPGMAWPQSIEILKKLKTDRNKVLETNVFGRVDYSDGVSIIDVHLQISRWCLYRWNRWKGHRKQIGVYVPYGVDTHTFCADNIEREHNYQDQSPLPPSSFICGRIGKWHPQIFSAFAELLKICPDAVLLNVSDHDDAIQYAACLPRDVQSRILTIPKMNSDLELKVYYSSLDCLLQAAPTGESFGMVLAEAMACGTPVVTASLPHKDNAQVEVVCNGVGGAVAGSVSELTQTLVRFYNNNSLRKNCLENARRLIVDRYALDYVITQIERVANHALKSVSHDDLLEKLKADNKIELDIKYDEIRGFLQNTDGGPLATELMLMRLVHNPLLYKIYSDVRQYL